MTLIEDIKKGFAKTYSVKAHCSNCGNFVEVNIKRGITIRDYFNSPEGICSNCGCTGLILFKPKEEKDKNDTKR